AKMTSSIFCDRTDDGAWAPSTQPIASTTFDLPDPLGPTTTVTPGSSDRLAGSAKDLKPLIWSVLRNTGLPSDLGLLAEVGVPVAVAGLDDRAPCTGAHLAVALVDREVLLVAAGRTVET